MNEEEDIDPMPKSNDTCDKIRVSASVQILVFQHIKGLLPSHISLVNNAEVINISNERACQRILLLEKTKTQIF